MDAEAGRYMLYTTNRDVPGIIGLLGTTLGKAKVNIANFHLGRNAEGGDAIALLYLDAAMPADILTLIDSQPEIEQAKLLEFDV